MDIMHGVVMITIGVLAFADKLSVPVVLIAAFLAAFGSVFYSPAVRTLMLDIIPHDDMVRGQSVFSGASSFVNMVGTAFSGVIVGFFGVPIIVIFNGLGNLYSAVSELFINVPKTVKQGTPVTVKGIARDYLSAVKTIFSDEHLKLFVPSVLIINLLGAGPLALALPFVLEKGFPVDNYGYLMSVWTAASLISVLLLSIIKLSPKFRFWAMAIGFVGTSVFLALTYLSNNFVLICAFAFIGAFMNTAANMIFNAAFMLAIPEENRGAVTGFFQSAAVGGNAISVIMYGFLGDIFPLYIVFTIGAVISLIPMSYLCFHPKTKAFILAH
jgi:MFS family permease